MEDIIETLKLKINFCFDNIIDSHINAYNIYEGLKSNKLYTKDKLYELILAEFIQAVKYSETLIYNRFESIFNCYHAFWQNSDRHIKTGKNYEIYRLIDSLCTAKMQEYSEWSKNDSALYYSLIEDVEKLIDLLQN